MLLTLTKFSNFLLYTNHLSRSLNSGCFYAQFSFFTCKFWYIIMLLHFIHNTFLNQPSVWLLIILSGSDERKKFKAKKIALQSFSSCLWKNNYEISFSESKGFYLTMWNLCTHLSVCKNSIRKKWNYK